MESNGNSQPSTHAEALRALDDIDSVSARMAQRLHSGWGFHALRGLLTGLAVFGLSGVVVWTLAPLVVGLLGLIALTRWRARAVGFSRANPDRMQFLRIGAPWSIITLVVVIVALAAVVAVHPLGFTTVIAISAAAGLVTGALGPLADRSGRRHLGR